MTNHIIANSSPIILLSKIGHLDFLRIPGKTISIPQAVWDEVSGYPEKKNVPVLSDFPWLQVKPDPNIPPEVKAWNLGKGESCAISAGLGKKSCELIIDDFDARSCARSLGLQVRGTLGLIILAKKRGIIPEVAGLIDRLIHSGMYLEKKVIEQVLKLAGEKFKK